MFFELTFRLYAMKMSIGGSKQEQFFKKIVNTHMNNSQIIA